MRSALVALVATVLFSAGCADDGPSVNYPERVPSPSQSTQPKTEKLHWKVSEPAIAPYLGAYSSEDAQEVWDLAVELVKKWHIKPKLLQARRYFPREFKGVTKYMADKLAKQWRSDVRDAIRGLDRGGPNINFPALQHVFSLVVWNLPTPTDGAWRTPMVSKPELEGAVLPAVEALHVDMKISAFFRIDRGNDDALQPYNTDLDLYYRQNDEGEWKLDVYSGKYKLGFEVPDESHKKKDTESPGDGSSSDAATSAG
jgi:hypothetical protein